MVPSVNYSFTKIDIVTKWHKQMSESGDVTIDQVKKRQVRHTARRDDEVHLSCSY